MVMDQFFTFVLDLLLSRLKKLNGQHILSASAVS